MMTKTMKILMLSAALMVPMSASVSAQDAGAPMTEAPMTDALMTDKASSALVPALKALDPLVGTFDVSALLSAQGGEVAGRSTTSAAKPILKGFGLQEMVQIDVGSPQLMGLVTTFSYDPFRKVYRVTLLDDTLGMMDVYEGDITEEGVLSVTNLRSDTFFPTGNGDEGVHFNLRWDLAAMPVTYEIRMSLDKGETWAGFSKMTYTKSSQDAAAE